MDMAERNGPVLRRMLISAECLRDKAIRLGSSQVNTPGSRSRALLSRETRPDHLVLPASVDNVFHQVEYHPCTYIHDAHMGADHDVYISIGQA